MPFQRRQEEEKDIEQIDAESYRRRGHRARLQELRSALGTGGG
ncbi:MAG: hypothetical protein ACRDNK_03105 [Solirubrobacteraceae bacterium]